MPRGRFNYSRFGGFSGYGGEMGDPASSVGGQALSKMTRQAAPQAEQSDPLWNDIESTFQDILGEYANMDLDMPIEPPDMKDPQDQMRYLKDLESLGMNSAPSAALMGSNIRDATALLKEKGDQQKQAIDMLMKVAPLVADNPEMSSFLGANILNTMFPGQFDIGEDSGILGTGVMSDPTVKRLTPENATEGQLYEGISTMAVPQATELFEAGDKEGMKNYLDLILQQMLASRMNEAVAITIVNQIHADAIGASKAKEPVY